MEGNQMLGAVVASREWPAIVAKMVEKAKRGDIRAAEFCREIAWGLEYR